jgi:ADP-heptose:LPS heptosyltransferase
VSLPRALRLTTEDIPDRTPYVQIDQNLSRKWALRLKDHQGLFKIGIVWAGARTHRRDVERSASLELFSRLARLDRVRLFSLQKNDVPRAGANIELVDFTNDLHNFADTAALILNLDLVIGVDTAVVHLAGALGQKVWTLLPFSPDWRWLLDREDSPWYRTMRLFRQPSAGAWEATFARVTESLRSELGSR